MTTLFHYTDAGHAEQIESTGFVVPGKEIGLHSPLSWFTDLDHPHRDALGLTSHILPYDRTGRRFRVVDGEWVKPWHTIRKLMPVKYVVNIEAAPGAMLMHWWVAARPVPVVADYLEGAA